jgi:hypothetical protein
MLEVSLEKPPGEGDLKSPPPEAAGGLARRALESRRRRKFAWFLVVESIAGGLILASILAGLSLRFASESWTPVFRVLPVSAAVIATVVPILFYGNSRRHR